MNNNTIWVGISVTLRQHGVTARSLYFSNTKVGKYYKILFYINI